MASIEVQKKDYHCLDVILPTSKSYANRFLILAALNPKPVEIHDLPQSTDVVTLVRLLSEIGLKIQVIPTGVRIENSFPECEIKQEQPVVLDTGDGGTTNRFIAALLCLGSNEYVLKPTHRMAQRPMEEFIRMATLLGAQINSTSDIWLSIRGPIKATQQSLIVDAEKTTQILSAFAMVLTQTSVTLEIKNLYNSEKYWKLTESLLKRKDDLKFIVPVDFSSASYAIALAAVTGQAHFPQIRTLDPYQADSAIIPILQQMGALILFSAEGLQVRKSYLRAMNFNCSEYPDLSPTLAFLAACCDGPCQLSNTEILTYKETDRLEEIIQLLDLFDIRTEKKKNHKLIIYPGIVDHSKPLVYEAPPDHRMVMAAYLFMRTLHSGTLKNIEHVKKSFPNFFEAMTNTID